jgi:hypothetical protein
MYQNVYSFDRESIGVRTNIVVRISIVQMKPY